MQSKVIVISYKQSRREYFVEKLAKAEHRLRWWEKAKEREHYCSYNSPINIKLNEIGAEIAYLHDAIAALDRIDN